MPINREDFSQKLSKEDIRSLIQNSDIDFTFDIDNKGQKKIKTIKLNGINYINEIRVKELISMSKERKNFKFCLRIEPSNKDSYGNLLSYQDQVQRNKSFFEFLSQKYKFSDSLVTTACGYLLNEFDLSEYGLNISELNFDGIYGMCMGESTKPVEEVLCKIFDYKYENDDPYWEILSDFSLELTIFYVKEDNPSVFDSKSLEISCKNLKAENRLSTKIKNLQEIMVQANIVPGYLAVYPELANLYRYYFEGR